MIDPKQLEWSLGDRLVKARKAAKLEQGDIAKKAGVSRAMVSLWERDQHEPRVSHLKAIAEATEVPITWFLDAEKTNSPNYQTGLVNDDFDALPVAS